MIIKKTHSRTLELGDFFPSISPAGSGGLNCLLYPPLWRRSYSFITSSVERLDFWRSLDDFVLDFLFIFVADMQKPNKTWKYQ